MSLSTTTDIHQLSKKELKLFVREQLKRDLALLLDPYKNKDIGLRIIGEKTNVSEKTLKRVMEGTSTPHQSTIDRFYRYFFDVKGVEVNDSEIHNVIRKLLVSDSPIPNTKYNYDLENMLETNKVFREIFLYSRTGKITKKYVKDEFGKYGLEILDLMLSENILLEEEKGIYIQGSISVPKTHTAIKTILQELLSDHLSSELLSELGHNKAFYYIEGVDDQSKNELLGILDDYQEKILNYLVNEARPGDNRVFALGACDTFEEKIKIENNIENKVLH